MKSTSRKKSPPKTLDQLAAENKNKPWVSNYPDLQAFLDKHKARCLWQLPHGDPDEPQTYIEGWLFTVVTAPGCSWAQIAIIQIHNNQCGWNIYTDAGTSNTTATLKDAEQRMGLK